MLSIEKNNQLKKQTKKTLALEGSFKVNKEEEQTIP